MAVGGAEDKIKKRTILSEFVRAAGGSEARIAIIPAASMIPTERGALYASVFSDLGADSTTVVNIVTREDATRARNVKMIRESTGIFVTGGVQLRLISILGGTATATAIDKVLAAGGVYCGTSAGAAAVSSHMIVTGRGGIRVRRGMVDLAPGLGLVPGVILDQHFSQRGRFGRLIASVGLNPQFLGIGIDEDTAAIFEGAGIVRVMGTGQVVIVDASKITSTNVHSVSKSEPVSMSGLQLHLLAEGDRFDLNRRRIAGPPKQSVAKGHA